MLEGNSEMRTSTFLEGWALCALLLVSQTRVAHAQAAPDTEPGTGAPTAPPLAEVDAPRPPSSNAIEASAAGASAPGAVPSPPVSSPPSANASPATSPEPATQSALKPEAKSKAEGWKLKPPKLSGYIQVHFRHAFATGTDPQVDYNDFRVQRARLIVKGEALPWLGYDLEVDPRAPEVRGIMRDAFLAFKLIPRHELRVGQQKTQFGYENVESSTKLYAVNRAEVSDALSRGMNLRDLGVGLIGNVKLGAGFRIEDAVTVVNGAGLNVQADDTRRKDFWGRLGLRYKQAGAGDLLVRLGASGGIGDHIDPGGDSVDPSDDFRLEFKRLGADLEVDQRWFFASAEYVHGWDQDITNDERSDTGGYYVNLIGKMPWRLGPIARYDALGDEFARWTFGAFYGLPEDTFRVLLNYEYRKLKDGLRSDDKAYAWLQVRF